MLPGTDECRPPDAQLWPLSPLQIQNSVAQALPGRAHREISRGLSPYISPGVVFDNDPRLLNASPQFMAELVRRVDQAVDATLSDDPSRIASCLPDPGSSLSDACLRTLLSEWAARVYRRPLFDDELEALEQFHATERDAGDPDLALRLLLRRILSAPEAIFRSELGDQLDPEGFSMLTAEELADAVSYTLTDGPPDGPLRAAAADGSLLDPSVLGEHVERLVQTRPLDVVESDAGDPYQITGLMRFFSEWLDVDDVRFESGTERTLRWLANEPMMFLEQVLFEDTGALTTVLAADYTVWSRTLADFYGREERPEAGTVAPTLDGRRGVLMQGGFLTSHDGITARGLFVRERLFCQTITAPDDADMNLPGLEQDLEEQEGVDLPPREVRERHLEDPACRGCHTQIDPLGFPFDGFDPAGHVRADIDGFPIDVAGEILGTTSTDGVVAGPTELVTTLADSADVRACFVQQVYSFVHGRPVRESDTCYLESLEQRFEQSGGDIKDLVIAIMTDDSMRLRTPSLLEAGD